MHDACCACCSACKYVCVCISACVKPSVQWVYPPFIPHTYSQDAPSAARVPLEEKRDNNVVQRKLSPPQAGREQVKVSECMSGPSMQKMQQLDEAPIVESSAMSV